MSLYLNKAHYPVTTLGPGKRIGLWTQGCGLGCRGCCARDTWEIAVGQAVPVAAVLAWCRAIAPTGVDGITLSGGEPFAQPAALAELLTGFHRWRAELERPFDILCYSGLPLARLRAEHADLLTYLDALIPEPYRDDRPLGGPWRGSDNQPLIPLSPLGEARYAHFLDPAAPWPRRLQFAVDNAVVWCIGIPARGDLAELEDRCARRGLRLEQVSWRA